MSARDAELPVPVPPAQGERVEGEVVAGAFGVDGGFQPIHYRGDEIFSPAPELDRQHALAFNASGRASGSPPAPKPGPFRGFHQRSLRRI